MNPVPPVMNAFMTRTLPTPTLKGWTGQPTTAYGGGIVNPRARQRALCIAVDEGEPDLAELRELLRTVRRGRGG